MYIAYILYSRKSLKYYSGQTANLENRILEHNGGETPSIKHGIPWEVIWTEIFETRTGAMNQEKIIKGRGAKRFLEDLGLL